MTRPDDDLRWRFSALRRADEAAAPTIDALLERRVVRATRIVVIPAAIAAAAAILLVASLNRTTDGSAFEVSVAAEEPSILEWQSPTASLLAPVGPDLVQTVSTPTSSLLRGARVDLTATLHIGR